MENGASQMDEGRCDRRDSLPQPSLMHLLRSVVLPSVESLFQPDEIDEIRIVNADGECAVKIVAHGEATEAYLWSKDLGYWNEHYAQEKLTSELQDFISECTFGWGTFREPQDPHS